MRLIPTDPDIATIFHRIRSGDLDLQPEFQRGEVWSKAKKQRLIDSVLREWHVPPIHVIEDPSTKIQQVLDGQQRLTSIRDFLQDAFPVDGLIEPLAPQIVAINGSFFSQLSGDWKRRFTQFPIRVFRLVEYSASEPAELFFRLNQPTNLTGAEQRNAFFGPVREQIRQVVERIEVNGNAILGFANARMAYDDVLSRVALAIQKHSLNEKIAATELAELYRSDEPLPPETIDLLIHCVEIFVAGRLRTHSLKGNKASLFS